MTNLEIGLLFLSFYGAIMGTIAMVRAVDARKWAESNLAAKRDSDYAYQVAWAAKRELWALERHLGLLAVEEPSAIVFRQQSK